MLASSLRIIIFAAICAVVFISQASAHANDEFNVEVPSLHKRVLVSETLCDDGQDGTMANPLYHAVLLANSTLSKTLPDGTDFRHSTAFSNYFEDSDFPIVHAMFQNVNDYTWNRESQTPSIWLLCSQPDSVPEACKDGSRIALADPDPYPYTWDATKWLPSSGIGFCASFFDPSNPQVQTFVYQKSMAEWCTPGKRFDDYYTVGFLTLNLFAQTDAYALAGLPARSISINPGFYPRTTTQGAGILSHPSSQSSQSAARQLKVDWATGKAPELQRVQNGASYAAAATEWYFLTLCGRSGDYSIPA